MQLVQPANFSPHYSPVDCRADEGRRQTERERERRQESSESLYFPAVRDGKNINHRTHKHTHTHRHTHTHTHTAQARSSLTKREQSEILSDVRLCVAALVTTHNQANQCREKKRKKYKKNKKMDLNTVRQCFPFSENK